ncbi:glycosyltransferase [Acidiphilium sp.]|uniref:glycosyltransferase n=1 Tax=Acidiphilium sp. TaxID=527 RepID=UPI00258E42D7|nr:glycosyltransferase [Acidiphilium sp.]
MPPGTDAAFARVRDRRNDEAVDAWRRARLAIAAGDPAEAAFWLDRVCRLAPDDGRPRYERALLRAATGDPEAAAALADIATRFDHAGAWIALARLRHAAGAHDEAAAALAELLARHEVPPALDDGGRFETLATAIARAAGFAGWRGIAEGRRVGDGPDGANLLGAPDLAAIRHHDGIAVPAGQGIEGWVAHPAAPWRVPRLTLVDRAGTRRALTPRRRLGPSDQRPFVERHGFRIGPARLAGLVPPFILETASGAALAGTPIDPAALAALKPARIRRRRPVLPPRAPLCAVMPAYRDAAATADAIASFRRAAPRCPLVVVDDASPEPALVRLLDEAAAAGRIALRRHRRNRGFPAAANAGIAAARRLVPGCDILLLNADILLPPRAPARLHAALYRAPDIASVTPLSNEATIMSYPARQGGNPAPDLAATTRLDALARRVNGAALVDIPTAIGFCMAIRHDALDAIGGFDAALFAQGYGEENDWCRRAALAGWRHAGAPGIFVAHRGGASFGATTAALCARNLAVLERRHPGYAALIAAHHEADPLRDARRRLDLARFAAGRVRHGAVALVAHDHGGGIARVVAARMAALRESGLRPILLSPDLIRADGSIAGTGPARLADGGAEPFPNLVFDPRTGMRALVALLRREGVRHVEFHHTLGHDPAILALPARLGVPADHVVHDYAHFCKRVNLIGPARRYCGEPGIDGCETCLAAAGSALADPIAPAALRARSAAAFAVARRVAAPSADAAARLRRHFPGLAVAVTPWEDDDDLPPPRPPAPGAPRRIALAGGIGPAKGFDVLLACARDAAARALPLSFVLAGTSEDDAALIATGRVRVTGAYEEGEAQALLRDAGAALGFLPSIWPETWCFALGELWRAGLYVLGFDIGAPAARIRATRRGDVLPLGLPPARINDILLAWQPPAPAARPPALTAASLSPA